MDIFSLLDELQTIARNGLYFSSSPYDRERYKRLLDVATRNYTALLDLPAGDIRARFVRELGYITPKVGADAAIFNAAGEILLMERADGSGWCLALRLARTERETGRGRRERSVRGDRTSSSC